MSRASKADAASRPVSRRFFGGHLAVLARVMALVGLLVLGACSTNANAVKSSPAARVVDGSSTNNYKATRYQLHWNPSRPLSLYSVADEYISQMTLNQELGQLIIAAFSGTDFGENATMVEQQGVGGMLLYTANMTSEAQTTNLIATSQAHSSIPMLVLTDEEGGYVDRLEQFYGFRPSATQIGEMGSTTFAQQQGALAGKDMAALGFNADFAPDVDVQLVAGPDQISRTFGSTPQAVTQMAGAYMTGMQSAGVAVCLKHFPGLGAATTDAHLSLPVINRSLSQIESVELAPYQSLIATGQVQMIMTTDLLMPALDPTLPAELSPAIITGVLRQQLGYNGVVVTDALYMDGITKKWSEDQAAVMAIEAGDDMLVGPFDAYEVSAMEGAIEAAISDGQITKARIDESVRRILTLKMRMGLLPIPEGVAPVPALGSMTTRVVDGPVTLPPQQ
ncbi:MAG: glycoside hydrolase family 3 N-terminal domain-containing protein [Ktedonobacterales bacterium]